MVKHRIGMRTLKTAISICICMLIYVLFKILDTYIVVDGVSLYERESGFRFSDMYSPFFAGIAAAYSLYPSKKQSMQQAYNRVVASLLGGIIGMILTIGYGAIGYFSGNDFFTWPNMGDKYNVWSYIVPYTLVTIFVVVVITVGNAIHKKAAIFVGILTFLSVTINPMGMIVGRYNSVPFVGEAIFGMNRIASTLVGVLIALGVNLFRLPHKNKNDDILFVIGVESMLNDEHDTIKGYMNYKLNNVCDNDINVTLFTTRVPSTFMYLLDTVHINHPVVCMSGAALYDTVNNKYLYLEEIDKEVAKEIDELLENNNIHPFKNYIIDDLLNCFLEKIDNEGINSFYQEKKNARYANMILAKGPTDLNVLHYMFAVELDMVSHIVNELESKLGDKITVQVYDSFMKNHGNDLKFIKIYSKDILNLNVLKKYANENNLRIAGLTTSNMANNLLNNCDIRVSTANVDVENTLKVVTYDDLFKSITRIYYSADYKVGGMK